MPFNLLKIYSALLELEHLNEAQRTTSLRGVFSRDIENNPQFFFQGKQVRPIKKDGEEPMETLFRHLTTRVNDQQSRSRVFEMARSKRLHWIRHHVDGKKLNNVAVFSCQERIEGVNKIRTYIYDIDQQYVLILEPYRNGLDYYLLTAYYLDESYGRKQIEKKLKNKLPVIH